MIASYFLLGTTGYATSTASQEPSVERDETPDTEDVNDGASIGGDEEGNQGEDGGDETASSASGDEPDDTAARATRSRDSAGGRIARADVRRVIDRHERDTWRCYRQRRVTNPELSGVVHVTWNISTAGLVTIARIQQSSVDDEELERCLLHVVRSMRFPRPEGGSVNVTYPFAFGPSLAPRNR